MFAERQSIVGSYPYVPWTWSSTRGFFMVLSSSLGVKYENGPYVPWPKRMMKFRRAVGNPFL